MQIIKLTGIDAQGRHGASDGERDRPQPFRVDVVAGVEPEADALSSTADYREIMGVARDVVSGESHSIIETIAQRVADRIAAMAGVVWCRAVVHKPEAADRHRTADIAAEASSGTALPHGG